MIALLCTPYKYEGIGKTERRESVRKKWVARWSVEGMNHMFYFTCSSNQAVAQFLLGLHLKSLGSHWISIPGLGRFILDQRKIEKGRGKLLRKLGTVNLTEKLRFVEEGKATVATEKR